MELVHKLLQPKLDSGGGDGGPFEKGILQKISNTKSIPILLSDFSWVKLPYITGA